MSTDEAAAKAAYPARMEAESPFYTNKQAAAGSGQATTASAAPASAVMSTDEAAAKAAYLARMEAESPFYTKKQGATEAATKAAYLARMEAESPFYTKKQGVVGAALASTMHSMASTRHSMASADIEGCCCGSTLRHGSHLPATPKERPL